VLLNYESKLCISPPSAGGLAAASAVRLLHCSTIRLVQLSICTSIQFKFPLSSRRLSMRRLCSHSVPSLLPSIKRRTEIGFIVTSFAIHRTHLVHSTYMKNSPRWHACCWLYSVQASGSGCCGYWPSCWKTPRIRFADDTKTASWVPPKRSRKMGPYCLCLASTYLWRLWRGVENLK